MAVTQSTAPAPPAASGHGAVGKYRWPGLALAIIVGVVILSLPTPHGLTPIGQRVLAIAAFTILLWIFQVMNAGVASILMLTLMVAAKLRLGVAFNAFSGGSWWVLLVVLYYGFVMQKTGLAKRLAYYILSVFPGTYTGITTAFFVIGLVLCFGIPSNTVRTAIMVPIAWSLVKSIGLPPRSKGSALIMLSTVEAAVIPGGTILFGSLLGPVVQTLFRTKGLELSFYSYARVIAVPHVILCVLLLIANQLIMKPESPLKLSHDFAKRELHALGSFKRQEMITALVVLFSIVFWMTDRWHHLPSFWIGIIALVVFSMTGVIKDSEISTGVPWTLMLFLGGVLSLAEIFVQVKLLDWVAIYMVPFAQRLTFSVIFLLCGVAIVMYALRFLDNTGWICVTVLFLPIVDLAGKAGVPPMVLMGALVLSQVPFWVTYQHTWVAMTEGITGGEAFSAGQRVKMATVWAVLVLVTIIISVGYWKLIGAM